VHLTERLNNDQFFILIGVFTSLIVVSYCIRNRPTLLKSLFLANLKKTHFKFVSNNIQDQIVELLFWNSLLLQSLFFISYLIYQGRLFIKPLFFFLLLVFLKRLTIIFSEKLFQVTNLTSTYFTSFIIMVIHLGWVTVPILILKTTYFSFFTNQQLNWANNILFSLVIFYLFYRLCTLLWSSFQENISFLHIIFYLCTLEILPFVLISSFLIV
jgi:hypothetical protein